ncbi:hypothetical protein [Gordonia crocea]|uniref:Uncharacterized protein n=1 Tax=Gordonia crocea TaxID=589162 RepID=A0A7I9UYZ9_9ACTN|nr:hypothetical protein [Gordonia crocea]GED98152.1 hypothetical protein nbrc107697_21910 [Gordonia crocea]
MHHLGRAALATITAAAAVAVAVVGSGDADAAPRYTANYPTPITGTSTTGAWWQGFLLNRAQTRQFHEDGTWTRFSWWDPAAYNSEMARAFNPKRGGTGCIVVMTVVRNKAGVVSLATGPNYIRDEAYATQRPDAPNALYWSTKNFRCV